MTQTEVTVETMQIEVPMRVMRRVEDGHVVAWEREWSGLFVGSVSPETAERLLALMRLARKARRVDPHVAAIQVLTFGSDLGAGTFVEGGPMGRWYRAPSWEPLPEPEPIVREHVAVRSDGLWWTALIGTVDTVEAITCQLTVNTMEALAKGDRAWVEAHNAEVRRHMEIYRLIEAEAR